MEGSPDYKRLFLEAQRAQQEERERRQEAERAQQRAESAQQEERERREEAERAQREERERREEAERAQQEAERAQQDAEVLSRPTTLPEYLHLCHTNLHTNLQVGDKSSSTQGNPANANSKTRPNHIRYWHSFTDGQWAIWDTIIRTPLATKRLFASRSSLEESGRDLRRRKLGSEMDLNHYERLAEETPVARVIEALFQLRRLRKIFRIHGSVEFENHTNTLSTGRIEHDMRSMSLEGRRRSPRLHDKPQVDLIGTSVASEPLPRPRADQVCVYNVGDGIRALSSVSELKAPHKLPLECVIQALYVDGEWTDIDVDDIVCSEDEESPRRRCRRLVAAIVTQAYSYMVAAGLQYGRVATGVATIFLQVPQDEPGTVQYFVSIPTADVGKDTGWREELDADNRLHLTAVGQMIAFTLRALQARPYNQEWRDRAHHHLQRWEISHRDVLEGISIADVSFTEYSPSPRQHLSTRGSPILLRKRARSSASPGCSKKDGEERHLATSDDESGPETPSRPVNVSPAGRASPSSPEDGRHRSTRKQQAPRRKHAATEAWCTHACLLSLRDGGAVDRDCPNAAAHGSGDHQLTRAGFLKSIKDQLRRNLDQGCQTFGRHGSRGVFFKITLTRYGYTVAAKGTPDYFSTHLQHEAAIYQHLRPIQGQHVPVCLGFLELVRPYRYEGIAEIKHLLLLSFAGDPTPFDVQGNVDVREALDAVRGCGVLHGDVARRNILYDEPSNRVMVIDFDQAKIVRVRRVLGELSANRGQKRKGSVETDRVFVGKFRRCSRGSSQAADRAELGYG